MCEPMNEEELANALEARLARFRREVMRTALDIDVDAQEPVLGEEKKQKSRPRAAFPYFLIEEFVDRGLLAIERAVEQVVTKVVR